MHSFDRRSKWARVLSSIALAALPQKVDPEYITFSFNFEPRVEQKFAAWFFGAVWCNFAQFRVLAQKI